MMEVIKKLLPLVWPLVLLVLTGIAGYAFSQIRALSLPIPQALALFTVVLPLVTGISTQGVRGLLQRRDSNEQNQLTLPLIAVIGFQLIYETVVATLAMTYMIPPETLKCGLNEQWQKMFHDKNARNIRGIQDSLSCCGLNSVYDRAWPFLHDVKGPRNCAATTNRSKSCFGGWRQAEQINAGLLLLVAIIVFIVKVFSLIDLLTTSSWKRSSWYRPIRRITGRDSLEPEEDNNRALVRGRIEEANDEDIESQPYRDDELSTRNTWDGPRVEPSLL